MDGLISLAKEGYSAYQASQHSSNQSNTGGQGYNPHNNNSNNSGHGFNPAEVAGRAEEHHSGNSELYHDAARYANDNPDKHNEDFDEDAADEAHHKAYKQGGASNLSAQDMGGAAALQALKSFTGHGSGGGGGSKSELISLAMAEASKLFDKSGGAASGNKQDVVNGAAMTVMKLVAKSKVSSMMGGGGDSGGGMSSLMGLASKFI